MDKTVASTLAGAVLVCAGVAWWASPDDTAATAPSPSAAVAPSVAAASARAALASASASGSAGGPMDTARMFDIGFAGGLKLDLDTKASLEMISAELGANPSPQDIERIENSLRAGLPRDSAEKAIALVRSYRAYTQAAAQAAASQKPPQNAEELRLLLAQDAALRRLHFDPETSKALFGVQEAYSLYSLDAQAIDSDPKLGPVEKARRLQALRAALPPELIELEPALSPKASEMELRIAQLREQGGSDAQVQAVRKEYLGAEAAESVAQMEGQTAQWLDRYQAFQKQKAALLATSPPDAPALVEKLLAQHFSQEEIAGARAYDQQQGR